VCGRFTSTSSAQEVAEAFGVDKVEAASLPPRYNVAPTNRVLAVTTRRKDAPAPGPGDGGAPRERVLEAFRWGLVPSWAKSLSVGYKMINARSEGIGERPAYRRALVRRRCIIPVDSYYEWQARPGTKAKLPWAIHRRDGAPMAVAGLWEVWRDPEAGPDAEPVRSCTIVTTSANRRLEAIHDRMPVILGEAAIDRWLDPELADREELERLLRPAPEEWFEAYPVSTLVNKVGVDGPELLEPLPPPPGQLAWSPAG
jgi:putative SOS response-associated peptidase YedK